MLSLSKHPKELWILSLVELSERFAFWGVGNLLVLYLIEYYQFPNAKATHIYGLFAGLSTFLPLVGGWLTDRWNYHTPLFAGTLANVLGCFFLATGLKIFLYPALMILAIGYGIFTPSILAVLNYAYRERSELREAGFSIYYASINAGVFLALASLGSIANWVSWHAAFIFAGIVQLLGLIPLFYYMTQYKETRLALKSLQSLRPVVKEPLSLFEKKRLCAVAIFCFFSMIFWATYIQGFSSMSVFLHSYVDKMGIPEGIFLSSESFFLILLAPCLAALYAILQKFGKDPSPAVKTSWSFLALAVCFGILTYATQHIPDGAVAATIFWGYPVAAYFMMALGEMLLAPIGLSIVTQLAPHRLTGSVVGCWYVCVGVAFYGGGILAGLMNKLGDLSNFFGLFVLFTLVPGISLWLFAPQITRISNRNTAQRFTDVKR